MMTFLVRMPDKSPVYIYMPHSVESRLNGTCFRGRSVAKAGNFLRYSCFKDFVDDPEISVRLVKLCWNEILRQGDANRFAVRVSYGFREYVGWNSTTELMLFGPHELETFPLNSHVTAKRIMDRNFEAPLTKTVTLAIDFRLKAIGWLASINTIYPGEDVGNLQPRDGCSDISEREHRAFFDWNNPGEPVSF